ncbi:MAG: hypothetical protein ABI240_09655 [Sphingomonas sp.]
MIKDHVTIVAAAFVLAAAWGAALSAQSPPAVGTLSIEPRTADGNHDPSLPSFVNAAREALGAKGFTILPDSGHAAYVAELTVIRVDVGIGSAKAFAGSSVVAPSTSGSVGGGITVPLSTGKSRLVSLQRIRLEMRIRKRGEESAIWDGAAVTVRAAGTRKGADEKVASDLSEAVLRTYPARVGDVVGVP